MQVELNNGQLVTFLNDWEHVLGAMQTLPPDNMLESLFFQQVYRSQSLRDQIAYYDRLEIGHADRSYRFLVSAVRKQITQHLRKETRET